MAICLKTDFDMKESREIRNLWLMDGLSLMGGCWPRRNRNRLYLFSRIDSDGRRQAEREGDFAVPPGATASWDATLDLSVLDWILEHHDCEPWVGDLVAALTAALPTLKDV